MHFVCPVGRIPVLDELEARIWIKANRPGVHARRAVVLPRTADAKTSVAKTLLVRGEQCEVTWSLATATAGRRAELACRAGPCDARDDEWQRGCSARPMWTLSCSSCRAARKIR